jgi:glucosamine kinase
MRLGLGLDVGGTQCRWAVADAQAQVVMEGRAASFAGHQVLTEAGRAHMAQAVAEIRSAVQTAAAPQAATVCAWAGVTGFDGEGGEALREHLEHCLGLAPGTLRLYNDVELAHRVSLAAGSGYLVYAGTGCIATYLDEQSILHRVGGRGETLGDDGGGYWVGCQALKAIWRAEDEDPGYAKGSPLAEALFQAVGGSAWKDTQRFMALASRGDVGRLALAVAAVADHDPMARGILQSAGLELGRLATLLIRRFGNRPVWLAGGAFELHPMLQSTLAGCLPADITVGRMPMAVHRDAAMAAAVERPLLR